MRYLTAFGMTTLAVMLWSPEASCFAQNLPSGTYQETCRKIGISGNTLYAQCQDRDGHWRSSRLNVDRCQGDVVNMNGRLTCGVGDSNGRGYDNDRDEDRRRYDHDRDDDRQYRGGAPRGTYAQSCQDIHLDGATLKARCQERDGGWHDTALNNIDSCRGDIINENGNLRCVR